MKFALLISILVLIAFTQCEKESNTDLTETKNAVNLKLIDEVIRISSQSEQRLAYNLLSPEEKSILWKQKLTTILKSDLLSEQQRSHIGKLTSFINSDLFEKSNGGTFLVDSFAKSWCLEGLNYFTKEEIKGIAFSIGNIEINDNKFKSGIINPNLVGELPDCNCNSSSAWSCNSCLATSNCKQIVSCGFLWRSTCDGLCSAPMK